MTTIDRNQLAQTLRGGVNLNDATTVDTLARAGVNVTELRAKADVDADGFLKGPDVAKLFAYLDNFDHNGNAATFERAGTAGAIYDALGRVSQPRPVTRLTAAEFDKIAKGARAFMDKSEAANQAALARDGVGLLYGEKSPFAKMSAADKYRFVQRAVAAKNPSKANDADYIRGLISKMRTTSCIGYALDATGAGYKAAGLDARWAEILATVRSEGVIGTTLARELQADGWEAVYWSADKNGYQGPTPEPGSKAVTGVADQRYFDARYIARDGTFKPAVDPLGAPITGRDYYKVYPKYGLINFQPVDKPANAAVLAQLDNVPYFVGVALSGYHTIIGQGHTLRDSHLMRSPDDATNIENRPFYDVTFEYDLTKKRNAVGLDGRFVPSIEQSGIIMVPPGTFRPN